MWDLECLGKRVASYLEFAGAMADVTFRRIDNVASEPADAMYRERRSADKVYQTWGLKAIVDENPRSNKKGAMGAEIEQDIDFILYGRVATSGTQAGETYYPLEQDLVDYRQVVYEITRVERVLPSGTDSQMSLRVLGKRYR